MLVSPSPNPLVAPNRAPNAYVDGSNVYFFTGLDVFDDNVLYFIVAHEYAHIELRHQNYMRAVSYGITGAMLIANAFVPGVGLLNQLVNPMATNSFSRSQEAEADKMASRVLSSCLDIPLSSQVESLQSLKASLPDSGGFWDRHPSWDERIANIR